MGYMVFHSLMISILDDEDLPIYIQILKLHNVIPIILSISYGFGVLCADKQPHEIFAQSNFDDDVPSSSLIDQSVDEYDPKFNMMISWKWYYLLTQFAFITYYSQLTIEILHGIIWPNIPFTDEKKEHNW